MAADLVHAVKQHGIVHYQEDGWDVVIECYTDAEILRIICEAGATTPEAAIAAVKAYVNPYYEYREDIRGTAF